MLNQLRVSLVADPAQFSQHYVDAAAELEKCAALIARRGVHAEPGAVLYWPYMLHDTVVADIRSMKPHALIVLAHFVGLLVIFENMFWFTRGWAKAVVRDIDRQLAGRPELASWLDWPKQQVISGYG